MMAAKEIRISIEDLDRDGSPEVLLEFYSGKELEFSTSVSSSGKNENYDKVDVKGDADGDGDFDAQDDKLFISLAQAAVKLLK
ncbi:hypothetical protein QN386_05910 [Pseudomonas sp. CCI3.2]|uniref:hypothetical protein n=1 Tax=unclassified Pseudomonas TaxID=196821 RepID=UPI002AC8C5F6|nr:MULTISPECIES: hypothetical protein [unclassified Pseudomonas]MEB0076464.1 hypothetical protein [Pseudomonas sp. MH10out]MEB0091187.1 hypothetical protein [Pseudomonas sp. CCI4.2]MEB0100859.1 hypothetical protein [Pseudomonas sp. CCI3.2]MEB0128756.1 hypothetical protein [Pseudomonas sp. CCI2.4]MEB0157017.1 hypothetical protein [Pseudomonas sp. AH2 (2023)]